MSTTDQWQSSFILKGLNINLKNLTVVHATFTSFRRTVKQVDFTRFLRF